jgi:hypothetical protein
MRERAASAVLILFVFLAIGNFVLIVTASPAGSALGGRQDGDRYYVVNHSESAEVDRATWERRRVQEIVLLLTFPVAIVVIKFGLGQRAS